MRCMGKVVWYMKMCMDERNEVHEKFESVYGEVDVCNGLAGIMMWQHEKKEKWLSGEKLRETSVCV